VAQKFDTLRKDNRAHLHPDLVHKCLKWGYNRIETAQAATASRNKIHTIGDSLPLVWLSSDEEGAMLREGVSIWNVNCRIALTKSPAGNP